jgi:hypothetical protein
VPDGTDISHQDLALSPYGIIFTSLNRVHVGVKKFMYLRSFRFFECAFVIAHETQFLVTKIAITPVHPTAYKLVRIAIT